MDVGDIATWVGSAATVGALVAAVVAYRSLAAQVRLLGAQVDDQRQANAEQIKLFREQVEDQRRFNSEQINDMKEVQKARVADNAYQRREQASRVYMTFEAVKGEDHLGIQDNGTKVFVRATVENMSDRPIYDVLAKFYKIGTVSESGGLRPTIDEVRPIESPSLIARLMPRAYRMFDGLFDDVTSPEPYEVEVRFRDSSGVGWAIEQNGRLRELVHGPIWDKSTPFDGFADKLEGSSAERQSGR
jgi:hypothetical protein